MNLEFYRQPFKQDKYSGWVYDARNNFVFQFDEEKEFDEKGNYLPGVKELREIVIFSLNALDFDPIPGLDLSVNPKDPIEILNHGKLFITIRGWGNLTGIGGHHFDGEKASKIQDNFRDWLIYKLQKNENKSPNNHSITGI
jgi:hypothetical protein